MLSALVVLLFLFRSNQNTYQSIFRCCADKNDRAIRTAARWYNVHLAREGVRVLLLTNDADNRGRAEAEQLHAFSIHAYGDDVLVDCVLFCDLK